MAERLSKAEQKARTRAALIATAREEFAAHGYAEAATNRVVEKTNLTRGALYHHFEDKRSLFEAVFREEQTRLASTLQSVIDEAADEAAAFSASLDKFLDAMAEPKARRILIDEAPTVLGWKRWRDIDKAYVLGTLSGALEKEAKAEGYEVPCPDAMNLLVSSALYEAVQLITASDQKQAARDAAGRTLKSMLHGFRANGEAPSLTAPEGLEKPKAKKSPKSKPKKKPKKDGKKSKAA